MHGAAPLVHRGALQAQHAAQWHGWRIGPPHAHHCGPLHAASHRCIQPFVCSWMDVEQEEGSAGTTPTVNAWTRLLLLQQLAVRPPLARLPLPAPPARAHPCPSRSNMEFMHARFSTQVDTIDLLDPYAVRLSSTRRVRLGSLKYAPLPHVSGDGAGSMQQYAPTATGGGTSCQKQQRQQQHAAAARPLQRAVRRPACVTRANAPLQFEEYREKPMPQIQ